MRLICGEIVVSWACWRGDSYGGYRTETLKKYLEMLRKVLSPARAFPHSAPDNIAGVVDSSGMLSSRWVCMRDHPSGFGLKQRSQNIPRFNTTSTNSN